MHIKSLYLKNFRHFEEAHFEFGPKVNVIYGPNARGKTTILEAIYLMMMGHSFRARRLKEMIRHERADFFIEIMFLKHDVEQTLRIYSDGSSRKIFHNRTRCASFSSLLGLIPGTLMTPDDIAMIKEGPKSRRRYLDLQLAIADPLYVHYFSRYKEAMKQRLCLLKERSFQSIEIWENEMAKAASYIISKRYQISRDLQHPCKKFLFDISGSVEDVILEYKSQCPEEEKDKEKFFGDLYRKMRMRESQCGACLVGPHRDEFAILINGKDARYFSSEGQQKSSVAAMRFAEWECLNCSLGQPPLMLVDDLGVSLDGTRRSKFLSQLNGLNQVFVTTTEPMDDFFEKEYRLHQL